MKSPDLDILYWDSHIAVLNKPEGLLSIPGRGPQNQDSLTSRLLLNMEFLAQQKTPKLYFAALPPNIAVHRLDMDTSGVMVCALTRDAHRDLSLQFQERTVTKRYIAVLEGQVGKDEGEINLPFRLDPENRPHQVLDWERGRMGRTIWKNLGAEDGGRRTRVLFLPLTGRTHQLRLHAASPFGLGCPIVGDRLYGSRTAGERLLLHARDLEFRHPATGKTMTFSVPEPF